MRPPPASTRPTRAEPQPIQGDVNGKLRTLHGRVAAIERTAAVDHAHYPASPRALCLVKVASTCCCTTASAMGGANPFHTATSAVRRIVLSASATSSRKRGGDPDGGGGLEDLDLGVRVAHDRPPRRRANGKATRSCLALRQNCRSDSPSIVAAAARVSACCATCRNSATSAARRLSRPWRAPADPRARSGQQPQGGPLDFCLTSGSMRPSWFIWVSWCTWDT